MHTMNMTYLKPCRSCKTQQVLSQLLGPRPLCARCLHDRFWSDVEKTDGCWLWQGGTRGDGYGLIHFNGTQHRAHRVSWEMHYGPVPNGLYVCHHCDTRRCIRPDHLFLGTHSDNMKDAATKGHQSGERNNAAKLTWQDIEKIRGEYRPWKITQENIAERFGIARSNVSRIVNGKAWKDFSDQNSHGQEIQAP